ncbi:hypothetical protein Tco_1545796, partial [Tanacetum coccineum]
EIVSLMKKWRLQAFKKYKHVGQEHKLLRKSNQDDSRQGDDARLKILGTQSQKMKALDKDHEA